MNPQDEERVAEARRALERVSAETETIGTSALARATRHLSASDAPPGDPIELWGRRIGRGLGLLFFLYLVYTLVTHFAG